MHGNLEYRQSKTGRLHQPPERMFRAYGTTHTNPTSARGVRETCISSEPLLHRECTPDLDWRTALAARQPDLHVNLLSDAQRIFKFDAEISDSTVNLCVPEQKLNRSEISCFPAYLRRGPTQGVSAVSTEFKPNPAQEDHIGELRCEGGRKTGWKT